MPSLLPQLLSSDKEDAILQGMAKVTDAIMVCALVLVLDVAAGILGLAQDARNQQVKNCDIAQGYRFGVAAVFFFSAAFISSAGCDYLCPQIEEIRASMHKWVRRTWKLITASVYAVGSLMLVGGTRWCKFREGHVVAIGAILCFVHIGITIAFYMPAIVRGWREVPQQHP